MEQKQELGEMSSLSCLHLKSTGTVHSKTHCVNLTITLSEYTNGTKQP